VLCVVLRGAQRFRSVARRAMRLRGGQRATDRKRIGIAYVRRMRERICGVLRIASLNALR
jgi:hypothetical protein